MAFRQKSSGERPAPDRWSVAEILAHLSEAEIGSSWRYRQMIEHDGAPLSSYDQDLWETLGEYSSRDPNESLQLFRLLREANLQMFDHLTPEQWQRHGIHAERGRMSVRDLAVQVAGHDINHVAQIRTILGKYHGRCILRALGRCSGSHTTESREIPIPA